MGAPVTHVEILGPDRAELVRFYGDAFGWTFGAYDAMNYTVFRTGPGGIGGGIGTPESQSPAVSVYAEVPDIDAKLAEAKDLGATSTMGPFDIGGGKIAMFADPAGNVFGLYEGTGEQPASPEGTGRPIVWFDVTGQPAESLVEFYTGLFGWTVDVTDGYAHVHAEGSGIGGGISAPQPGMPANGIVAYVDVENIEAALDAVTSAGGTAVTARIPINEGLDIAFFRDPAGNLNGLCQQG